ncbi:TPA: hypothetical protein HA317_03570, partial [Candidatus Woesearchaeota archaeon]|nr:hypothetical protein [Candidatus Woesearchaeota archaeon]
MSEGKDSNPENTPVTKPEPDKDLDAMDVVDEFLARSEYALGRGWRHFKQGVFVTKKHIKRRYRRLTMPEHSSIKHSWVVKKAGHTVPKAGVSEPLPRKLHKHKKKLGKSRLYIKQRRTLPRFRLIALLIIIGVILLFIPWGYHHTITLHTDALDAKNCSTGSGSFCIKSWQGKLPMIAGKATLEFKPPVDLTTVRTTLKINATGDDPIYVNNKLFWNPAWDSYVKVASFKGSRLFKPEGSMANPAISPEDSSAGNDSASKGGGSSGWLQRLGWGRINNQEQTNNDQKLKTNNPDIDIYVSPEYANRTSTLKEAKTLEEWLEKNAKFDSVYFLGVNFTNPINPDAGEGFKKRSWTTINTTLRDTHQFYVYLKDSFNMTMGKRDWNSYMGKDEFRVSLIEVETNKLVFSKVFEDDDD